METDDTKKLQGNKIHDYPVGYDAITLESVYQLTQRYIQADSNFHSCSCENLRSHREMKYVYNRNQEFKGL
jgi:hypothetical protein